VVPDALEVERAQLDDYGDPPKQPKPDNKMLKADWQRYAEAMEAWRDKVRTNTDERYKQIGNIGSELRRHNLDNMPPGGA